MSKHQCDLLKKPNNKKLSQHIDKCHDLRKDHFSKKMQTHLKNDPSKKNSGFIQNDLNVDRSQDKNEMWQG